VSSLADILLNVENLVKYFPVKSNFLQQLFTKDKKFVHAVDDISFTIRKGETLGLVGESGSGKTTTGRLVLRLEEATSGKIKMGNTDILALKPEKLRLFRRHMQLIFQDPMASLNPYMKVGEAIRHPLSIHKIGKNRREQKQIVMDMLETVNLKPAEDFYNRFPKALSGGQRQRIVIARALVTRPEFVVADEAVAMLDVSVRSQLLQLMADLKEKFNLTYLFITHDLATTKYVCDRIAVMYLGQIVEIGSFEDIYTRPAHPYTQALISAVPEPDPDQEKNRDLPEGEVPNAITPPTGCRFHPRCKYAFKRCREEQPERYMVAGDHGASCFLLENKEK